MLDSMPGRLGALALSIAFLALGMAYAFRTPPWNVPDEPAHYNYVRYVAETGSLPILQTTDAPSVQLVGAAVESRSFEAPIERLRYESHQPPLYYLVGALIVTAAHQAGLGTRATAYALRLYSVILATLLVGVVWATGRLALPEDPGLALAAAAVVAFLPMHLAIAAGINNDNLANLLGAALVWLCLARLAGRVQRIAFAAAGALLCGAMLLTKGSLYGLVAVLPAATEAAARRDRAESWWPAICTTVAIYGGALAVSGWWFARNVTTYGAGDWFGMRRHDLMGSEFEQAAQAFIAGDPRVHAGIILARTRTSFWGAFGWFQTFFPPRVYDVLNGLALLAALGWLWRWRWRRPLDRPRPALGLLALAAAQEVVLYVWWNARFVQGQGRALFPALGAIAVLGCIGLRELGRPLLLLANLFLLGLALYALCFLLVR